MPLVPLDQISKAIDALSQPNEHELKTLCRTGGLLPSRYEIAKAINLIKAILLPGFFDNDRYDISMRKFFIGVNVERLCSLLHEQIYRSLCFGTSDCQENEKKLRSHARAITASFVNKLSDIKEVLFTDFRAMYENDPAARGTAEVIFCYPGASAILHHRVAHALMKLDVPLLPRLISEMSHSETGIDINPGATIGEYFSIDHGTGIVVGETCQIGHHVQLYQGVTLGAKSFTLDESGHPLNLPRHPIIEDHVTIYSNASVLGRITVGSHSIIGGNVWLTHSLPPNSRIVQGRPFTEKFTDGLGI